MVNNMRGIEEKVLKIVNSVIEDTEISIDQVDSDLSKLGMDSIAFIRMVIAIEEEFDIEVPDEYLLVPEINTMEKIINIVTELLACTER